MVELFFLFVCFVFFALALALRTDADDFDTQTIINARAIIFMCLTRNQRLTAAVTVGAGPTL